MRRLFVWLHRYVGLAMAAFLIIEGVTGSLIAFRSDLSVLLDPGLVAPPPSPGAKRLDLAALAERAEELAPRVQVAYFASNRDDQAVLRMLPRTDPATGKPYDVDFGVIILDPWTGKELTRLGFDRYSPGFLPKVMPFVYDLHTSLALGETGVWVLAILAILWTIDCFVGFYLTLPVSISGFWRRWKPAWLIKPKAGFFRLNFDLHRASGLWLWPMLFVFAWSSVTLLDKTGAYNWTMGKLFDYPLEQWMTEMFPPREETEPLKLDWRAAQSAGERLMAEQAERQGFKIVRPLALNHFIGERLYNYIVETDRVFPAEKAETVFIDADTGALHALMPINTGHSGLTITNWLRALHMIQDPVDYLVYRIFVCAVGLVVAMLSVTGVYIWWKKRRARKLHRQRRDALVPGDFKVSV
ncbi:MAG: PepSY-associated TM helix domain-containing protein [Methylocystis sp.]